jgi:hypothetical protein
MSDDDNDLNAAKKRFYLSLYAALFMILAIKDTLIENRLSYFEMGCFVLSQILCSIIYLGEKPKIKEWEKLNKSKPDGSHSRRPIISFLNREKG